MLLSAGRPELSVPAMLLMTGFAFGAALHSYALDRLGHRSVSPLLWRLLALGIGAALAMPVIAPGAEWASLSTRASGLKTDEIFLWSTNWYDLLCLVLAQPLGDLYQFGTKFLGLVAARKGFIPYYSSAFVGPVALTLALWVPLIVSGEPDCWFFIVLIGSLIMTLGDHTAIRPGS